MTPPGSRRPSKSSGFASSTVRSTATLRPQFLSFHPLISPFLSDTTFVSAPAATKALCGSSIMRARLDGNAPAPVLIFPSFDLALPERHNLRLRSGGHQSTLRFQQFG